MITCLDLLVMLCLMQPKMLLAFSAARAYCWLTFNLSCTRTLVLFCKAVFQLGDPQHVLVHRVLPPRCRLIEPELPVSPFLQSVQVSLDDSMTLWSISCSPQFCVTSKLAEDTFYPIIQIMNEGAEEDWTMY